MISISEGQKANLIYPPKLTKFSNPNVLYAGINSINSK